ncbi:MAG: response regulator [Ardenticatenaceae bacterium]|nr:response regulator [Anaerolineales bacterium]MCB8941477.1 response regulator [Ardenticatenaceae bacterium]MCB8974629.1 response regulator [Ardenticatenaceae bacterium]
MGYSVLVVDDDPLKRQLLRLILERAGFGVNEAADGAEALLSLDDGVPDLMTLDVMMPQMDGFAVCEKVRQNPKTAELPIIMVSARADRGSIRDGLAAGANRYLPQPVMPDTLLKTVNELLPPLES